MTEKRQFCIHQFKWNYIFTNIDKEFKIFCQVDFINYNNILGILDIRPDDFFLFFICVNLIERYYVFRHSWILIMIYFTKKLSSQNLDPTLVTLNILN